MIVNVLCLYELALAHSSRIMCSRVIPYLMSPALEFSLRPSSKLTLSCLDDSVKNENPSTAATGKIIIRRKKKGMSISHIFPLLWVTGLVVWLGMESDLIVSGATSQRVRSWHSGQSSPLKRIIIIKLLWLFVPGSLVSHSVISRATLTGNNHVNPASDWPFPLNSALLIKCTDLFCLNFNN